MLHDEQLTTPPTGKLGVLDEEITRIGLGCFGLSSAYGFADPKESFETLHTALDLGCQLLDTADSYGNGQNERLVAEALQGRRHQAVLGTKFGLICDDSGQVTGRCATPAYVREAAERSLSRLRTDVIDLYTLHRVDPAVPIEDTVGALSELVVEGKVRAIGLSEVTAGQLRRAHAVHRISALQSEYSLWMRAPETDVLPVCRELGIAFVAFSPLGRGFFSGSVPSGEFAGNDFRRSLPRFRSESLRGYQVLLEGLQALATRKGCTTSQLALSWLLHQGDHVFAIPGTRRREHLRHNLTATRIAWSSAELEEIDRLSATHQSTTARYAPGSPFGSA